MEIFTVKRIDQELSSLEKPALLPVERIKLVSGDIFIACAGFEERAIEGIKKLETSKQPDINIILIRYSPQIEENKSEDFEAICESKGFPKTIADYDRKNPEGFGFKIIAFLEKAQGRVYVDISGMSRILIVQILVALGKLKGDFRGITVVYSEAENYPPDQNTVRGIIDRTKDDSVETKSFISSGVFGVNIIPELSSFAMMGKPTRLVTFPSFDPLQLIALRNELQPTFFSFIHGIPHLDKDKWRNDSIKNLNHIGEIRNREEYDAGTLDYQRTLDVLLNIYDKRNFLEKILIAPIGSKMQTVAVGILRAYLDDLQIVYPTPKSFESPEKYTEGFRQMYCLPLDSFPKIPISDLT